MDKHNKNIQLTNDVMGEIDLKPIDNYRSPFIRIEARTQAKQNSLNLNGNQRQEN